METVRCPIQSGEGAAMLLDYVDRRLDSASTLELDRHIAGCVSCQELVAAQRAVWQALDTWNSEPVSADFNRKLFDRIETERANPLWRRAFAWLTEASLPFQFRPAMPLAAACMMLVAGFLFRAPREADIVRQELKTELTEIEAVENTLDDIEMLRQLGVAVGEDGTKL